MGTSQRRDGDNAVHVACVADRNYGPYAGVTLSSVVRTATVPVHLHLLSDGISEGDLRRFRTLGDTPGVAATVHDIRPILDTHHDLAVTASYPRAVYGRLCLEQVIPGAVDTILYLDGDVICRRSVGELWAQRDRIGVAGAVVDEWVDLDQAHKQEIGRPPQSRYFNSGVLLINLKAWRARQLSAALFDIVRSGIAMRYLDQDAINILIGSEIDALPRCWNTLVTSPHGAVTKAIEEACIVHYTAALKPWHVGYGLLGGRAGDLFREAKADSPWRRLLPDLQIGRVKRKLRGRLPQGPGPVARTLVR